MTCSHTRSVQRLRLEGEFNIYTAASRKTQLLSALRKPYMVTELDLAAITDFDTAGVQLLLLACNVAIAVGGALRLLNVGGQVQETIGMLRLGRILDQAAGNCPSCLSEQLAPAQAGRVSA